MATILNPPLDDPNVDPRNTFPHLVVWSAFNIIGAITMFLVLVLSLCIPHLRKVLVLLNLEAIITVSCATGSILIWTGHALDKTPPIGLCAFNAAVTMSNSVATAVAALGLTISVWSQAMISIHPSSRILQVIGHTPTWLFLPYLFASPIFISALTFSSGDKSLLFREPFNCSLDHDGLHMTSTILSAGSVFLVLVFCAWTTSIIVRARWRARIARTSNGRAHLRLLIRVLGFGACVSAAFVSGITQLVIGFADVYPDLIVAWVFGFSSFVFGSHRDILHLISHCSLPTSSSQASEEQTPSSYDIGIITLSPLPHSSQSLMVEGHDPESSTKPSNAFSAPSSERVWGVKHDPPSSD